MLNTYALQSCIIFNMCGLKCQTKWLAMLLSLCIMNMARSLQHKMTNESTIVASNLGTCNAETIKFDCFVDIATIFSLLVIVKKFASYIA